MQSVNRGAGHSHVLDAVRTLLADGEPHSAQELCASGVARHLLPAGTIAKYVYNAIVGSINRDQLRGLRPAFVELEDGRFRLNVPVDPFRGFAFTKKSDPGTERIIQNLVNFSRRRATPDSAGQSNIGAPFEQAVTSALGYLGLLVTHDGRQGEPDVVAIAPLGSRTYTAIFECKSVDAHQDGAHGKDVSDADATEPARFRDRLGAEYAILVGPQFALDGALDQELDTHGVGLWTVDDLVSLINAQVQHPIAWSSLRPLFAKGRQSQAIADFVFAHLHGARERALVAFRYVMEEGLSYQRSLAQNDPEIQPVDAPLTAEALTMLVNERLANEHDEGRMGVEDIRAAIALATHPAIGFASEDQGGISIEVAL